VGTRLDGVSGLAYELADVADSSVDRLGPDIEQGRDGGLWQARRWWRMLARTRSARVSTGRRPGVNSLPHLGIITRLDHYGDEATFVDWEHPPGDPPATLPSCFRHGIRKTHLTSP